MNKTVVAAVLILSSTVPSLPGQSPSPQPIIEATVCEILAQPKMFHGKRIRTRATVTAEVAYPMRMRLTDKDCIGELPVALDAYVMRTRSYRRLVRYMRQGVPVETTSTGQFVAAYGRDYFWMQSVSNVVPKGSNTAPAHP